MSADYRFYNANPLGEIENDCVCRAISRAMRMDYYLVERKLCLIGELFECEELCVCCYAHLLEKVFGLKQRFAGGLTVGEIAKMHPNNAVLIRIDGHLTVCENGRVYDTWDCRNDIADVYWVVE